MPTQSRLSQTSVCMLERIVRLLFVFESQRAICVSPVSRRSKSPLYGDKHSDCSSTSSSAV